MPVKSNERRQAIVGLRKRGNFILHQQKDELKPVRRPRKYGNNERQAEANKEKYIDNDQ